jgi:hypothetical protein
MCNPELDEDRDPDSVVMSKLTSRRSQDENRERPDGVLLDRTVLAC